MISLDRFSELVADIYDTALDPALWERSLGEIATAVGANMGALLIYEPRRRSQFITVNLDPAQKRKYDEYYGRLDPVAAVLGRTVGGKIMTAREVLTEAQLRGEFFSDWAHPNEVGDGIFVNILDNSEGLCLFGIANPWRADPFATSEVLQSVSLLAPHIRRAIQSQLSLGPMTEVRGLCRKFCLWTR